jgi:AcrR family transcriptional regulator
MLTDSKGGKARAEILEAAKRLFVTQGYGGTSMRDIARASGERAVAGIYNHFKTKHAIFAALLDETSPYDEILAMLEATAGTTAPEVIANVLRQTLPLMLEHYDFVELVQIDMREFRGENLLHLFESNALPRLLNVLQRLEGLPGLKPIEPFVLMRMVISVAISFVLTQRIGPRLVVDYLTEEAWIEQYIETFLHGVAVAEKKRNSK